eukprot:TRINITY_DN24140_c0_g1_i2.p1 TRINITY_DN24140_c0_g1~~TRINITY_DN24140_c0_g1_i2.p1  ORF type:complete len:282 (-),score=21.19 TRINITY_DN24140_c0_g1_i2:13-801(-)
MECTMFQTACKWSSAVDFVQFVQPTRFLQVKWFLIGDDDQGVAVSRLLDYLSPYNFSDRIVMNLQSKALEEQRHASFSWNLMVRMCNRYLPHSFMLLVLSSGALLAARDDLAGPALENISRHFQSAYDVTLALLYWKNALKFAPMGGRFSKQRNNGIGRTLVPPLLYHGLRNTAHQQAAEQSDSDGVLPEPEELLGPKYIASAHYAAGLTSGMLDKHNCRPPGEANKAITWPLCGPCPRCDLIPKHPFFFPACSTNYTGKTY